MPKPKTRIVLPYNLGGNIEVICPSAVLLGTNHLHDYALLYRAGILTAEPKKGHIIDTPVYSIAATEERHIDKCFAAAMDKIKKTDTTIPVIVDGKIVKRRALMYVVDPSEPMSLPTPLYLRLTAETLIRAGVEYAPIFSAYAETRRGIINKADT